MPLRATTNATVWAAALDRPQSWNGPVSHEATTGSPYMPSPTLARVMPSWATAM